MLLQMVSAASALTRPVRGDHHSAACTAVQHHNLAHRAGKPHRTATTAFLHGTIQGTRVFVLQFLVTLRAFGDFLRERRIDDYI